LNETGRIGLESSVTAWAAINWADGNNYVCIALKNRTLSVFDVEQTQPVWKEEKFGFDIVKMGVVAHPPLLVLATACGKVLSAPLGPR
jgi:hypothetical protein